MDNIGFHPKGPNKIHGKFIQLPWFNSTPVVQLGTYVAAGFQQGALRIRRRIHRLPWWNGHSNDATINTTVISKELWKHHSSTYELYFGIMEYLIHISYNQSYECIIEYPRLYVYLDPGHSRRKRQLGVMSRPLSRSDFLSFRFHLLYRNLDH